MRDPPKTNSFLLLLIFFEAAHLKLDLARQKYKCILALVSSNLSTNLINWKITIYPTNDRIVLSRTPRYDGHFSLSLRRALKFSLISTSLIRRTTDTCFFIAQSTDSHRKSTWLSLGHLISNCALWKTFHFRG